MTPVRRLDIGRLIGHLNCTSIVGHGLINIERGFDIIGAISSACIEQRVSVVQVGEAVSQMDQATQPNAALVEESAAAVESLKGQAQAQVQAVVFKPGADAAAARGWPLAGDSSVSLWPRAGAPVVEIDATLLTFKTGSDRPVWSEQFREPAVAGCLGLSDICPSVRQC